MTVELKINVFSPLIAIFCQMQPETLHPLGLSTVLSCDAADWFLFILAGHLQVEIRQIISKSKLNGMEI